MVPGKVLALEFQVLFGRIANLHVFLLHSTILESLIVSPGVKVYLKLYSNNYGSIF
jgi:hypothetical protein